MSEGIRQQILEEWVIFFLSVLQITIEHGSFEVNKPIRQN